MINHLSQYISDECYKSIEASLERAWNSWPFVRIWKDGKRLGYHMISDHYDIFCKVVSDKEFDMWLQNRDNGKVIWKVLVDKDEGVLTETYEKI